MSMLKTTLSRHGEKRSSGFGYPLRRLCLAVLLWQGCAGTPPHDAGVQQRGPSQETGFFNELDAAVAAAGVQEASSYPVDGFPYLRTNRFLTAMKDRISAQTEIDAWVSEMHGLAIEARRKEINNLPAPTLKDLSERIGCNPDRKALTKEMIDAAVRLKTHDRNQPGYFEGVKRGAHVPDEYSTTMRIIGLYALAAVPVTVAAQNANKRFRQWHRAELQDLPVEGRLILWGPGSATVLSDQDRQRIFSPDRRNALGLPTLDEADVLLLVRAFAPVIAQDVVADYDRFGEVQWQNKRVHIDPMQATVYYYLTHSFIDHSPALQINYAFWYSERSGKKSPAYEKGPLDGLTVRVSLDPAGRPTMVDVMNNCGCYHFYAPLKGRVAAKKPDSQALYPYVARWLSEMDPTSSLTIRINSGWHQVEHLYPGSAPVGSAVYRLLPYDILESLPHEDGRTESVFDSDGIMKDSRRIEPYILFSMGIPRIGYMRQRGHHAIHIVGRAHFTDADLFDRYFTFR